jgi:LysR family hydrogen peroxide-inducible transcriptional activator
LEQEIGFLIFDRAQKPVQITALGSLFIDKAMLIVSETQELKNLVNHDLESLDGEFRMGIIPTIAPYLLARFLPDFVAENKNTSLIISELQSEDIISQIKSGELDLAILATPIDEKQIIEEVLYYEPFLGYFPKNHPQLNNDFVDMENIDLSDILILNEGHCFRNQTLSICNLNPEWINSQMKYQSGSIETIKSLIEKDMGFSLIPALATYTNINTERVRSFKEPVPSREIAIIYHKNFHKNGLIRMLKKAILANISEDYTKNEYSQIVKWR